MTLSRSARMTLWTGVFLGPVVVMGTLGLAQKNATKPNAHAQTSKQAYKNVQVLKNLPADQMIPIMQKISQSLGVRCDFCHDLTPSSQGHPTGWEKDTKPEKKVARQMIVMTNDINARFRVVDRKVTCFTCHHGHAMPENTPPAGPEPPRSGGAQSSNMRPIRPVSEK